MTPATSGGLTGAPLVVWFVWLVIAAFWFYPAFRLVVLMRRGRAWVRTTAIVIEALPRQALSGRRILVEFSLPDGQIIRAPTGFVSVATVLAPEPGTSHEIVYDPARPQRVATYWTVGSGLGTLVLLLMFYLVVAVVLVSDGRRKQAAHQAGTAQQSD